MFFCPAWFHFWKHRTLCTSMLVVLVLQSIQTIDIWMQYASTEMFYWNENCICLPFQKYDWNLSCTLLHIDIPGIFRIAQGGTYHKTLWSDYKGISILKFQTFVHQLVKCYLQISCATTLISRLASEWLKVIIK